MLSEPNIFCVGAHNSKYFFGPRTVSGGPNREEGLDAVGDDIDGAAAVDQDPGDVHGVNVRGPAAGIGRALRNLAPKSRSIGKRYTGNHRKYRFLTPDRSAP